MTRLTPTRHHDRIELAAGAAQPLVVQHAAAGGRPYLHPLRTPGRGTVVTENAPAHHPWQHGLYFGLNGVNGAGFWTEGLHRTPERDGRVRVTGRDATADGWHVTSDWCGPGGDVLLSDRLDGSARVADGALEIDLAWTVTARVAVTIARYDYGGLFLRMPYRPGGRATLLTPDGDRTPAEAEGAALPWLGVAMEIESAGASVVLMDHPANAGRPALWRADGEYGIGPAIQRRAALDWPGGHVERFVYRVRVADAAPSAEQASAAYARFAKEPH